MVSSVLEVAAVTWDLRRCGAKDQLAGESCHPKSSTSLWFRENTQKKSDKVGRKLFKLLVSILSPIFVRTLELSAGALPVARLMYYSASLLKG